MLFYNNFVLIKTINKNLEKQRWTIYKQEN